jgi:hypothetical protein
MRGPVTEAEIWAIIDERDRLRKLLEHIRITLSLSSHGWARDLLDKINADSANAVKPQPVETDQKSADQKMNARQEHKLPDGSVVYIGAHA